MMPSLNNLKIAFKLSLIVGLLAIVTVGVVALATNRMRSADDAYSDVVGRLDRASTVAARAGRTAEAYLSSAFQLAAETTDEGNAKYLEQTETNRKAYTARMAEVLKDLPEERANIEPIIAGFEKVFVACAPAIKYAASTNTPEGTLKAAQRLKAECVAPAEAAIEAHVKMIDDLLGHAASISDNLTEEANFTIRMIWILSVVGLLVGLGTALLISIKGLSQPIAQLKAAMEALAGSDLTVSIPGIERGDELGEMARTVEVFKKNALEVEQLKAEQQAGERRTAEQRKADMIRLANEFEGAVGEIIETVSSASTELEASAATLTKTATRAQEVTLTVVAASEQSSTNVQSVSSATEELSASVNEISRQVQESARIANGAVDQVHKTNDRVGELSQAAARIGDVVELINTIAGQTNLLALNATIEAARAGDAGRGFAVVASEVKALAEQTAKATGEIGQQIAGIQAATQESVGAIREISGTIEKLSEISSTIAAAVEEQGAATREIARNVQQAAHGTQQVSANIVDVQRGAGETGSASLQVLSAAQLLSRDSSRLKLEVGKFLSSVRAA